METARAALHDLLCLLPSPANSTTTSDITTNTTTTTNTTLPTLAQIFAALMTLLSTTLTTDRTLLPLLTTLSHLLDASLLQPLLLAPTPPSPTPRTLLSLIQKSHYKSTSIPKLTTAVHIYHVLARDVPSIRGEALKKLVGMLALPFVSVRWHVAEAVWMTTGDEGVRRRDWGIAMGREEGRREVERLRAWYVE